MSLSCKFARCYDARAYGALKVDALTLGAVMSFYYYSYSTMQLVADLSFDRFGARRTLTFAAFICALGTFLMGSAHSYESIALGRLFTGCGSACAFIGVLFLGKRWFKHEYFYLVAGITEMLGCLGAIFGVGPTALVVNSLGWRQTLISLSVIGLVLALVILIVIRRGLKDCLIKIFLRILSIRCHY